MNLLFAELDANGWVLIIGAVFLGLGQLVTILITHSTKRSVNGSLSQARDDRAIESKKLIEAVSAERFQAGAVSGATEERINPTCPATTQQPPKQ
jgi:hypothetical protein